MLFENELFRFVIDPGIEIKARGLDTHTHTHTTPHHTHTYTHTHTHTHTHTLTHTTQKITYVLKISAAARSSKAYEATEDTQTPFSHINLK